MKIGYGEMAPHAQDELPDWDVHQCWRCIARKHHRLVAVLDNDHGKEALWECLNCGNVIQAFYPNGKPT